VAKYNIEAIVLKKISYGDADRIYTLLTKDKGKITAVARGVRKISSRRGGNLDTLNHINITLSENTSGYKTITEVKTLGSYRNLKKSLECSLAGYYMAELINKSVEENSENNDVFFLLRDSLDTLDADGKKKKFVVNKFEFLLMKLLGYEMSLNELRSFKKEELDNRLKLYVKESLGEDFKSLTI